MWSFPQNSSSPPHKGKLNQRERSVLEQDLLQLFLSSCPVYPSACLAQVDLESCPRDPRQREVNLGMSQGTHKGVSALPQSLPTTLTWGFSSFPVALLPLPHHHTLPAPNLHALGSRKVSAQCQRMKCWNPLAVEIELREKGWSMPKAVRLR